MPGTHVSIAESVLIKREVDPQSVNGAAVNGVGVDTMGWDSCEFIATKGLGAATVDMKLQDSADNAAWADIAPAIAIPQIAIGTTNVISILACYKNTRRYVRAVITAGAAATLLNVISVRHRATGRLPVTQDAGTTLTKVVAN